MGKTPARCSPRTIMPRPAIPLRMPRFDLSSPLTAEAEAPRAINTREKPQHKRNTLEQRAGHQLRRALAGGELLETHAGNKGQITRHDRQHTRRGKRQESRPAGQYQVRYPSLLPVVSRIEPCSFYGEIFYYTNMAERGGFEPPIPEGIHDFESCAINRTLPPLRLLSEARPSL